MWTSGSETARNGDSRPWMRATSSSEPTPPRHADEAFSGLDNILDPLDQHLLPELGVNRSRLTPTEPMGLPSMTVLVAEEAVPASGDGSEACGSR